MRFIRSSLVVWVFAALSCLAVVRAEPPLPAAPAAAGGDAVFVSGVPDRFDEVRAAVQRARETSGRRYRVIVVDGSAAEGDARALLDRILSRWTAEVEAGTTAFDPTADLTILLDTGHRLLAMKVPSDLEVRNGLDQQTIEEELIRKVFVPRARDGLYDKGLAELVTATETWVEEVQQKEVAQIEARRTFRTP